MLFCLALLITGVTQILARVESGVSGRQPGEVRASPLPTTALGPVGDSKSSSHAELQPSRCSTSQPRHAGGREKLQPNWTCVLPSGRLIKLRCS
jgi:hypothetical protein